ncbi:MAG TPA: hypothetical protein VGL66_19010 [Caulobacteraceae bacterium]
MRKALIGAAAAAGLLAGSPALAQPAPGSLCDFIQGAVIQGAAHFNRFKGSPGTEPGTYNIPEQLEPPNGDCGVIDHPSTGETYVLCTWHTNPGVSETAARAEMGKLTKEVGGCLGSGRKPHPAPPGLDGVAFAEDPIHDRAMLTFSKDDNGTFEYMLMIYPDP